jgi:hypothetical protein
VGMRITFCSEDEGGRGTDDRCVPALAQPRDAPIVLERKAP